MFRILYLPVIASTIVLGMTISAQAQWTPVIAKQKELLYRIDEKGSEIVINERRGTYHRSSAGSVMHTWTRVVDGQEAGPALSVLVDTGSGNHFVIDHGSRNIRLLQQRPVPILPRERNLSPEQTVGQSIVNGVDCVGLKVLVNGQPSGGVDWVSISHDLHVKTEFTLPNGKRIVKELYDIEFVEPDSSVFEIPEGYTQSAQQ